ncbi:protein fam184a-like [Plakobranchus ocellatus]|uniref:Protein fam184a-like n=1 Tax=Plakobranchus ocellatus TaxID=259542 RepID=A0AAV4DD44_9GAST|nr:protein fam184a-like [Plakobranchus ocellatus]
MSAHHQDKTKKSFEFRMSKKVAELTQVVHMLFTRNHEKEVEIEALKKSYEHEIDLVLQDARGRIQDLETQVADTMEQMAREHEKAQQKLESELAAQDVEWRQKLKDAEKQLQEEKAECQNLRDLLINAQRDIENLRQGVTDQLSFKSDEISQKQKEAERLRAQVAALETELKDSQRDAQAFIAELQKTSEKLEGDVRQLHLAMENSHKTRDQLLMRNKQLEADMKSLKREFNKKATESRSIRTPQSQEMNEEVERLRREIQRYRLELSNRDNNFNRMFTEKQPMLVNQKSQKQGPSGAIYAFNHANSGPNKIGSANGHIGPTNGYVPDGPYTEPASSQGAVPNTAVTQSGPNFLKGREQLHKINFMEPDNPVNQLERQQTVPERSTTQDRIFPNSSGKHRAHDTRPRTQGQHFSQKMRHDRLFSFDRNALKQASSALYPEEPTQILPQRSSERPISSSLPSICSTPEQRRLSAQTTKPISIQLTKPKPLPREALYGK